MSVRILTGDALTQLRTLPDASVNCCVTSPPYYGLRDYGMAGQIGLEETPDAYVAKMVEVLSEVKRVLRDDGTLWLNIGDSYNNRAKVRTSSHQPALNGFVDDNWSERAARGGVRMSIADGDLKEKDLIGIPWLLAFALRADGWYLRKDIIWHKPNPMPESVRDRPTSAHEYVFLFAKSSAYHYDADAIAEETSDNPITVARNARADKGIVGASDLHGTGYGQSGKGGWDRAANGRTGMQSGHGRRHEGFNERYEAAEPSGKRNKRSVWTIATKPFSEAHFATMAPELAETCIKAGCPIGGTVLDPFGGAGTTGMMADRLGRNATLIELNPAYVEIARKRLSDDAGMFAEVAA